MITTDYQALRQHFINGWSAFPAVPVLYDNQPNERVEPKLQFVRFSVRAGASFHHAGSAQDGTRIQRGRVWLQIFTPAEMGDGEALAIADEFAALFRNKRIGDAIQLKTEDIQTDPNARDGYFMISVSVPWESYRSY